MAAVWAQSMLTKPISQRPAYFERLHPLFKRSTGAWCHRRTPSLAPHVAHVPPASLWPDEPAARRVHRPRGLSQGSCSTGAYGVRGTRCVQAHPIPHTRANCAETPPPDAYRSCALSTGVVRPLGHERARDASASSSTRCCRRTKRPCPRARRPAPHVSRARPLIRVVRF